MAKKTKPATEVAAYTIRLGGTRRDKVERYRAQMMLDGTRLNSIEEAVNKLVDTALEVELVN